MFPAWHIGVTALVTAVFTARTTGASTAWPGRQSGGPALGDLVGVSLAAGTGVLLWRLGANIPSLNDDPIPRGQPSRRAECSSGLRRGWHLCAAARNG